MSHQVFRELRTIRAMRCAHHPLAVKSLAHQIPLSAVGMDHTSTCEDLHCAATQMYALIRGQSRGGTPSDLLDPDRSPVE